MNTVVKSTIIDNLRLRNDSRLNIPAIEYFGQSFTYGEFFETVTIGDNVWIASGSVICPGVTIGENSIIGANSVVTKDIPPNVLACGAPCKVVRMITEKDRISFKEI